MQNTPRSKKFGDAAPASNDGDNVAKFGEGAPVTLDMVNGLTLNGLSYMMASDQQEGWQNKLIVYPEITASSGSPATLERTVALAFGDRSCISMGLCEYGPISLSPVTVKRLPHARPRALFLTPSSTR